MVRKAGTRIRIISSRGHEYAQEVRYLWDRVRKRGVTKVIRTLGPVRPTRRLPGRETPERIRELWKEQQEDRSRGSRRPADLRTNSSSESAKKVPPEARETVPGRSRFRVKVAAPQNARSLTGRVGLDAFDRRILELIRQDGGFVTRASVTRSVMTAGVARPNHRQSIRRHVSFSITRLENGGLLARTGVGGRGEPFRYRLVTAPFSDGHVRDLHQAE
jgi:hypothetical protein